MFIPALEYRKYIQRPRTAEQKNQKLINLALRAKKIEKSNRPYQEFVREIARAFYAGEDILSPEIFPREDIEEFAKENGILNDNTVQKFIDLAQTRLWWHEQNPVNAL